MLPRKDLCSNRLALCYGWLLKLGVFCFGLRQYWDVGVGIFPEAEEILIVGTGLSGLALQGKGAREADPSKRPKRGIHDDAAVIEKFLKFSGSFIALVQL